MRTFLSFLILLSLLSDRAMSDFCDSQYVRLFEIGAVAATDITGLATFMNSLNYIVGSLCGERDFEEIARNIARYEDRKQECKQATGILSAHEKDLNEIRDWRDIKIKWLALDQLRRNMRVERMRYFQDYEHFDECKFRLITKWGCVELALIDIMIRANNGNEREMAKYRELYGDSLIFYIKKGSEMFSKFPLKIAHDGNGEKAMEVAKMAAANLRPMLIKWIEAVESNTETRRRLRHKGLSSAPSDVSTQWYQLGLNRDYLPLKIQDSDWISHKFASSGSYTKCDSHHRGICYRKERRIEGPTTWLSCHNSIHNSEYCGLRACPGLNGINDGRCGGESFEIQSTRTGPIKYGSHIALRYGHSDSSRRGKGNYWLSTYYGNLFGSQSRDSVKLYTMKCVGSMFTSDDVGRCDKEVFTIKEAYYNGAKYLRNGDYVEIDGIDNSKGFMMKLW